MKYLILFLTFFTTSVFANTVAGPNKSFTIAGRTFVGSELDNMKMIRCSNAGADLFNGFKEITTTTYRPPANTAFKIYAARFMEQTGHDRCHVAWGTGDVPTTGLDSGVDPGVVGWLLAGSTSDGNGVAGFFYSVSRDSGNSSMVGNELYFGETERPEIPANATPYYVYCMCDSATSTSFIYLWGKEE